MNFHAALQANIRLSHRNPERVGKFTLKLDSSNANPYLNYAVPDDDIDPSPEEIKQLIDAFRSRDRQPRFEYVPAAAPRLEVALVAYGFRVENRLPILVCTPDSLQPIGPPPAIELLNPASDEELAGLIRVTKEAYEGDTSDATPDEIHWRRAFANLGGIAVLARDAVTREPAGSGICEVPVADVSELATVGVRPAYEGRGIAAAVTARLAADAFKAQVRVLWLAPLHGGAERIYRRVGFEPTSETLHLSLN